MIRHLIPRFETEMREGTATKEDGEQFECVVFFKLFSWLGFSYCYGADIEW